MSTELLRLLALRRAQLVSELENSLLSQATAESIHECERTLLSLDKLAAMNPVSRYPKWLGPVFVLGIAVTAVGAASLVALRSPRMVLDAYASTATLSVPGGRFGLVNEHDIPVDSIQVTGDSGAHAALAGTTRISKLEFAPGSTVSVSQEGECFSVQMLGPKSSATGIGITAVLGEVKEGRLPGVGNTTLHAGATLKVCSKLNNRHSIIGRVARVDLSRLHHAAEVDKAIRTASIKKGSLYIPVINKKIDLTDGDQLLLKDISDGWVHINFRPEMRIALTGDIGLALNAGLVKARPDEGTLIAPTLLDWARDSSVTGLVGMLTGLIGMIWSVAKYFGYRSP